MIEIPEELIWISERAARLFEENDIDSKQNFGCANCSGCDLEDDFINFKG